MAIVGTDTGVGKTTVTRFLRDGLRARGVRVNVFKPFVCGRNALGGWDDLDLLECRASARYNAPLSPLAAMRAGEPEVSLDTVRMDVRAVLAQATATASGLLIEGIGGVCVPLAPRVTWLAFHAEHGWPAVVVGRAGLGTVNHTLLTLSALSHQGIPVVGFILNEVNPEPPGTAAANAALIAEFSGVAALGFLRYDPQRPVEGDSAPFDWAKMEALLVN